jgi:WhiB family redox-sensing transcriptional regulator
MAYIKRLPMPIIESYEWQFEGACNEADPETFFSPQSERGSKRRQREAAAKAFCARCPVVDACLQHALEVRESHGVWGGLNADERRALLGEQPGVTAGTGSIAS